MTQTKARSKKPRGDLGPITVEEVTQTAEILGRIAQLYRVMKRNARPGRAPNADTPIIRSMLEAAREPWRKRGLPCPD